MAGNAKHESPLLARTPGELGMQVASEATVLVCPTTHSTWSLVFADIHPAQRPDCDVDGVTGRVRIH